MNRQELAESAITELLARLPKPVAERLHQKYEDDRTAFLEYVKAQDTPENTKEWAKPSCTDCHGRGIIGTLSKVNEESTTQVVCPCTTKRYTKWLVKQRKEYIRSRGYAETTDT